MAAILSRPQCVNSTSNFLCQLIIHIGLDYNIEVDSSVFCLFWILITTIYQEIKFEYIVHPKKVSPGIS